MKNYVQPGDTIDMVAPGTISAGTPIISGNLFGIATIAGTVGQTIPCVVEGVVEVNKDTNLVINLGDRVFWDAANSWVDKTAAAQVNVGTAIEGTINTAPKIKIKLGATTPAGT